MSFRDYVTEIISELKLKDKEVAAAASKNKEFFIQNWPESEREKFRKIAQGEWKKMSTQSPNAKKAYETITTYLKSTGMI